MTFGKGKPESAFQASTSHANSAFERMQAIL